MNKTVFVVMTHYDNDGEVSSAVIGVFGTEERAKQAMQKDIAQIKEDWSHINFDDPDDWDVTSDDETCYEGFTPSDDYSYSIHIEELPIQ